MMAVNLVVILFLITDLCSGVIYEMNDLEYDQMPPLFGIDSNYNSCLMQPGGVYCVAKFELHGNPHNGLVHAIKEYSQHEIKHYNHSLIDRAICVTQSCKKFIQNVTLNEITVLNMALEGCVNETIWTDYGLHAKLAYVLSCDKHGDQVHVDYGDWTLAGILTIIVAMTLIGSLYDIWYMRNCREKNNITVTGNPYLLSFSILRNWEKLSNTEIDLKYDQLRGLNGLKSITIFFVASAHVMWLVGSGYTDNPRELETSYDNLHYQLIFSGMVIVQIFFVISGCLLTFNLQVLSETKTLTWKDIPRILFFRWARLTPANAIIILFTATWLRQLGSGPLWKMFVTSVAADCRTHWWKHLLYFNNYVPQDKYCAVQTWHLATEMQVFIVGLVIYIVTAPQRRYIALIVLALIGIVAPAVHVWLQDLDALVIVKPEFYRTFDDDTYRSMHVLGHNNLSCYAIGMIVGLLSYYCTKHKIEYPNNMLLKLITWCIPPGIVGLFLSGKVFYVDGDRPHVVLRMAYAAIQRPALGVMTAVLLLNLVLKFENGIRSILEWRGWMVISRLCYGVFLIHVNIVHVLLGARTQLDHVSFFHVIIYHFGIVSLSFAASIPFYLMLEAPMTKIIKVFTQEKSEEKQKKIK